MAISFVDDVTTTSTGNDSLFVILKPSGVVSGDFLIASVAHYSSTSEEAKVDVTPPAGWTLVADVFPAGDGYSVQLSVMTKVAGPSEPGSWSGSFSDTQSIEVQSCVAYRGVSGLGENVTDLVGSATSYSVGSVQNTSASNWRVLVAAYASSSNSYTLTSNEVRKVASGSVDPGVAVESAIWDSNGTVATGSHSRTVSRGAIWGTSAGWIAILVAGSSEIPGDLAMSLPLLRASMVADQSYSGPLAATLPLPAMAAAGIATPPSGTLAVLVLPTMSAAAAHHAAGSLAVLVVPVVGVVGETRAFGIRTVTPERESRVTRPQLGATD